MKNIPLILMGCGGVGRYLIHHIISCRSFHAQLGVHLRIVGVSDSKSLVVVSDVFSMELDDKLLSEICRIKSDGSSLLTLTSSGEFNVFTDSESTKKVIDTAGFLGQSTGLALVDCSASSETIGVLNRAVDLGCCIILANKKPLTSSMEDFSKLVSHPRRIRHESTVSGITAKYGIHVRSDNYIAFKTNGTCYVVGAGLPVIASLRRIISSGDPVHRIVGSLSGTLGYVMSEVEVGKPLSHVVKCAKSLGFTEPDPRDDLSGMDVARKALIIARLLGKHLNLDEIKIESLYPAKMGQNIMSTEEFLERGILLLDNDIQERVSKASLEGKVLRYVCVVEGSRCEVGIEELPKDSPLGRLRGSDNVLEIYSRCYERQPLVIQGAGAGNDTTAAGVLADIIDVQDLFR